LSQPSAFLQLTHHASSSAIGGGLLQHTILQLIQPLSRNHFLALGLASTRKRMCFSHSEKFSKGNF